MKEAAIASSTEINQEDTGEYPGTINQGQLFSIIENGTMFDIIELNETTLENIRSKDAVATTTENAPPTNDFYTTVIYHKEPPENVVENSSTPVEKQEKKLVTPTFNSRELSGKAPKVKTTNDLVPRENDKTLSKEVEMFPVLTNSLQKLNRTNRKEVPPEHDDTTTKPEELEHTMVEISLPHNGEELPHTKLFVSTKTVQKKYPPKKYNKNEDSEKKDTMKRNLDGEQKHVVVEIDPGLDELNKNVGARNYNFSEMIPTSSDEDEIDINGVTGIYNESQLASTSFEGSVASTADTSGKLEFHVSLKSFKN